MASCPIYLKADVLESWSIQGCVSCGRTDWAGFVVPQLKWRSPENVCGGGGVL